MIDCYYKNLMHGAGNPVKKFFIRMNDKKLFAICNHCYKHLWNPYGLKYINYKKLTEEQYLKYKIFE